jgi:hypothetical protein
MVVDCLFPLGCNGRRPEGLELGLPADASLGAYFAEVASLEAASVPAFRRLDRELAQHRAPEALRRRARAAAHDEVRHARAMRRLAQAHGTGPVPVRLAPFTERPLVEMARENAMEGCVRETFGAALALWQAEHATDPEIRKEMRLIAEDEASHAELAWDVAAWAEGECAEGEREAVAAALRQAVADLESAMSVQVPEAAERAGLPSGAQLRYLFEAVRREFWGEA